MKIYSDRIEWIYLTRLITKDIIIEAHEGLAEGNFLTIITLYKIFNALFWWPMLEQNIYDYCKQFGNCQEIMTKPNKHKNPLHLILSLKVFQR